MFTTPPVTEIQKNYSETPKRPLEFDARRRASKQRRNAYLNVHIIRINLSQHTLVRYLCEVLHAVFIRKKDFNRPKGADI